MAVLTIILVPSLSIVTKSSKKNLLYIAFLLHVIFIAPILAVQEKNVAVELKKLDKTAFKKLTAGVHSSETNTIDPSAARIYGKQASVGGDRKAEGRIHLVSSLKIKRQCQLHECPVWSWCALNSSLRCICSPHSLFYSSVVVRGKAKYK